MVNVMTPAYIAKLNFTTQKISIIAQKIDGLALEINGRVSAGSLLQNKLWRVQFFEKIFLLADTSMEVVLGMFFFSLSNANLWFDIGKLT